MSIGHIIGGICNARIEKVNFTSDNTALLSYKHRFMKSLHAMDSRS